MTSVVIEESDRSKLESEISRKVEDYKEKIRNPTFKCNGEHCEELHQRKKIYKSDFKPLKYSGYHQVECTLGCKLVYHPACWKEKEKIIGIKAKELINADCFTPDCPESGGKIKRYFFEDETGKKSREVCTQNDTKEYKKVKKKSRKDDLIGSMLPLGLERERADSEVWSEASAVCDEETTRPKSVEPVVSSKSEFIPPDKHAVPLRREDSLEEFTAGHSKKKGKKKGRDKKKPQMMDMSIQFKTPVPQCAGSSSTFVGEELSVPQPSAPVHIPAKPLALAEDQGPGKKFLQRPKAPVEIPVDVSVVPEEKRWDMIAQLEESPEVKEFLELVVSVLIAEGTWMSVGEGVLAEIFSNNGTHGNVQRLIELYGGRKEFLEATRDDANAIMMDPSHNRVILKDHLLHNLESEDRDSRSFTASTSKTHSSMTTEEPRSRSAESSVSSSGVSSSSNDQPVSYKQEERKTALVSAEAEDVEDEESTEEGENEAEEGGVAQMKRQIKKLEKDLGYLTEQYEHEVKLNTAAGLTIQELNDQLFRSSTQFKTERAKWLQDAQEKDSKIQELEAEKSASQPETNRLKQELKSCKDRIKQLLDMQEREKTRSKEELEKTKKELTRTKDATIKQLTSRATDAEVVILESKKQAFNNEVDLMKKRCSDELTRIKEVSPKLKGPDCEQLKSLWADYGKQWMLFQKELEPKRIAFMETIDDQIAKVRSGMALGTLVVYNPPELVVPAVATPPQVPVNNASSETPTSSNHGTIERSVPKAVPVDIPRSMVQARNISQGENQQPTVSRPVPVPVAVPAPSVMKPVPVPPPVAAGQMDFTVPPPVMLMPGPGPGQFPIPYKVEAAPGFPLRKPPVGSGQINAAKLFESLKRSRVPKTEMHNAASSSLDRPNRVVEATSECVTAKSTAESSTGNAGAAKEAKPAQKRNAAGDEKQTEKLLKELKRRHPKMKKEEFIAALRTVMKRESKPSFFEGYVDAVEAEVQRAKLAASRSMPLSKTQESTAAPSVRHQKLIIQPKNGALPGAKGAGATAFAVPRPPHGNNKECYVCHEAIKPGEKTEMCPSSECGVRNHVECLEEWLNTKSTCPICHRHMILNSDFPPLG